jgi:pentalenic acid synthase
MSTMSDPTTTDLPVFPMRRSCPYHPPEGYERLTAQGPLARAQLFDGRVVWCVTGHAETRALLLDMRLSSDWQHDDFPVVVPRGTESMGKFQFPLVGVDDPEHARQRRLVVRSFSARHIKALRPQIQEIADGLVDVMVERGPDADVVSAYALPLSIMVICRLLGVPYTDREFFETQASRMLTGPEHDDVEDGRWQLMSYLAGLIAERTESPGVGLLDELIAGQADEAGQTSQKAADQQELISIVLVLLLAGLETTANMIALSVLTLLDHPDQAAELRADGSLLPNAVEELLRFLSVTDGIMRLAKADIEIGDQVIRTGEGVFFPVAAGNRDPGIFDSPDTLNLRRPARNHLAFGHGAHQCIGQNLARAELEIGLGTLFSRLPNLALAVPVSNLEVRAPEAVQGVANLPVTW